MAMLREDWAQEQAALKPVDLKAVYADRDSDHIRVGSFAYLDDKALLKYGDINAPRALPAPPRYDRAQSLPSAVVPFCLLTSP